MSKTSRSYVFTVWLMSMSMLLLSTFPCASALASGRQLNAHLPTTSPPPAMPVAVVTPPTMPEVAPVVAPIGMPVVPPSMPTVPVEVTVPSAPVVSPTVPVVPVVVTTPTVSEPGPTPVSATERTSTTLIVIEGFGSTLESNDIAVFEAVCLSFLQSRLDGITMCKVAAQMLLEDDAVEFELMITGSTLDDQETFDGQVAQLFMEDANQLVTMLQDASDATFGGVEGIISVAMSTLAPVAAPPVGPSFRVEPTVYLSIESLNGRLKDEEDIAAFDRVCASFLTAQEIQGVRGILRCTISEDEQILIDAGGSVQMEVTIVGLLDRNRPAGAFGAQIVQEFSEGSEIFIASLKEESLDVFGDVVRVTASLSPTLSTSAPTVSPLRMDDNNDIFGIDRNIVIGAGAGVAAVALLLCVCLICRSSAPPPRKPRTTPIQSIPMQPTPPPVITPPVPVASDMRFPPPHPAIPRSSDLARPSAATTEAIDAVAPSSIRKAAAPTLLTASTAASSLRSDMVTRRVLAPPGRLGITVDTTDDGAKVYAVHEQSPLRGYLFPGDYILSINNMSTRGITGDELRNILMSSSRRSREMEVASQDVTDANIQRAQR